jgi:hypothetical protein
MTDKLCGLVMIINTILPAVFFLLVLGASVFLWRTLERDVVPRIDVIANGFSSLKTAAEEAAGTVQKIVEKAKKSASGAAAHAEAAVNTLSPLATQVQALRKSVDMVVEPIAKVKVVYPTITVTKNTFEFDETYKIIGRVHIGPLSFVSGSKLSVSETSPFAELRTPFDNIGVALDTVSTEVEFAKASVTEAGKEILKLAPLVETFIAFRNNFDEGRAALVGLSDAVRSTLRPVAWAFGIFALLAVPWLAISYAIWSMARLKRGYTLLRA